jgi:hypothetical protein
MTVEQAVLWHRTPRSDRSVADRRQTHATYTAQSFTVSERKGARRRQQRAGALAAFLRTYNTTRPHTAHAGAHASRASPRRNNLSCSDTYLLVQGRDWNSRPRHYGEIRTRGRRTALPLEQRRSAARRGMKRRKYGYALRTSGCVQVRTPLRSQRPGASCARRLSRKPANDASPSRAVSQCSSLDSIRASRDGCRRQARGLNAHYPSANGGGAIRLRANAIISRRATIGVCGA